MIGFDPKSCHETWCENQWQVADLYHSISLGEREAVGWHSHQGLDDVSGDERGGLKDSWMTLVFFFFTPDTRTSETVAINCERQTDVTYVFIHTCIHMHMHTHTHTHTHTQVWKEENREKEPSVLSWTANFFVFPNSPLFSLWCYLHFCVFTPQCIPLSATYFSLYCATNAKDSLRSAKEFGR